MTDAATMSSSLPQPTHKRQPHTNAGRASANEHTVAVEEKAVVAAGVAVDATLAPAILFHRLNKPFGEFSTVFHALFELDGCIWRSVQHFYQASKFPPRSDLYFETWRALTPRDARTVAETNGEHIRTDWFAINIEVFFSVLRFTLSCFECL